MVIFFFFNDTATTEIYTLSLHDALPISRRRISAESQTARVAVDRRVARIARRTVAALRRATRRFVFARRRRSDRKSTRLNSSHSQISYAVFCLKKKTYNN